VSYMVDMKTRVARGNPWFAGVGYRGRHSLRRELLVHALPGRYPGLTVERAFCDRRHNELCISCWAARRASDQKVEP
jgi:hypothetical protein